MISSYINCFEKIYEELLAILTYTLTVYWQAKKERKGFMEATTAKKQQTLKMECKGKRLKS